MRTGVFVVIASLVLMTVGFALAITPNSLIAGAVAFIIGLLLGVLGIVMINRDIETLLLRIEINESKPSPEDIKKRPIRRPRKG
ncbi:hypothetical protein [Vulcanisaeta thermophila]|uniref:hypothetical protein n=1 Tax=Vulcanisaeta thermophila TaxID=867917 RepID=UPI000853C53C|nr:hypothetical protein [Vulcanisaeta thermophila]